MLACLCGVSSTTPACRRVLEDLDWASDEVLEDCLGAVRALRPQAHLLRNQLLLPIAVSQDSLAEFQPPGCSAAVAADRAEVVAALLRLLRLLLPLLKECKRMNGVSESVTPRHAAPVCLPICLIPPEPAPLAKQMLESVCQSLICTAVCNFTPRPHLQRLSSCDICPK